MLVLNYGVFCKHRNGEQASIDNKTFATVYMLA